WMIDREGQPLTDPTRANEGLLLPLGGMEAGFKGYGLSLVFGLLAGTLNGAAMGRSVIDFNNDDTSVTNTGHAVVAIDPEAFGDAAHFRASVDALVRDIRGSKRLPGVERIWMPGEQSHLRYAEALRDGVMLSGPLAASLDKLADDLGIAKLRRA
ncbi:MAG: Ldh family oxidoreductase, partial [Betaproteobacteria bacterium]|nr:Ldh family oxidoreductase [Betaproteobacteria bacterium]